jgi:exonuclease III
MMRIVTWNSHHGNFENKLPHLLNLDPDIATVQECARPSENGLKYAWCGANPNQGLLVLARNGFSVREDRCNQTKAEFFLPVRVEREDFSLNILAVWAKESKPGPKYMNTLFQGVRDYSEFILSAPTIIIGDLNTQNNLRVSAGQHMNFVNSLRDRFGLVSIYHRYFEEEHGYETRCTYFDKSRKGRGYHLDYCFVPESWLAKVKRISVGQSEEWSKLSDHVPLIIDIQ